MDRDLAILREAALISMEQRALQQEAKELAALREAALDSARERKLSSDPLRKRRLETPPSHHYINIRSGDYQSCSDSDGSGNMTPKMSECDSAQHTPPRCDPIPSTVFTVKVTDNMLLTRNNSHRSDSSNSNVSENFAPLIHPRKDDTITVKLTNDKKSLHDETEDVSEEESEKEKVVRVDNPSKRDKSPVASQRTASASQVSVVTDVSPAFSKVSSADDSAVPPHTKKLKKKHKKKKSSTKHKKSKHQESSSEGEKPVPKPNSNDHKTQKKQNGVSAKNDKPKTDTRYGKLEKNLKKQIINELDSKIDKNIELLQKAKRQKHDNKSSRPVTKKIISEEISSNEEEELLKPDKKKSASPKHSRKDKSKKRKDSKARSRSPSPGPDISVSLKSKREFEQMKAEMNKKATKHVKKSESSKSSPRKESRSSTKTEEKTSATPKKEDRPPTKPEDDLPELTESTKNDDMQITEKEEEELLEEDIKSSGEKKSTETPNNGPETNISDDFVNVMKEDSFSDSDEKGDVVNITSDKKLGGETKKKKSRKNKKKKHRDEKKRKKKRKKRNTDSSSDIDSDGHENKKPKVKIDKSELNKIVQFLKQRDEAQKALDAVSASKTAFNPKIISKEAKPIEIKLKSKPKR